MATAETIEQLNKKMGDPFTADLGDCYYLINNLSEISDTDANKIATVITKIFVTPTFKDIVGHIGKAFVKIAKEERLHLKSDNTADPQILNLVEKQWKKRSIGFKADEPKPTKLGLVITIATDSTPGGPSLQTLAENMLRDNGNQIFYEFLSDFGGYGKSFNAGDNWGQQVGTEGTLEDTQKDHLKQKMAEDIKNNPSEPAQGQGGNNPTTLGGQVVVVGESRTYSIADYVNAKQCALLSDMYELALFRRNRAFSAFTSAAGDKKDLTQHHTYKGRIMSCMTKRPENIMNDLTLKTQVTVKGTAPSGYFDYLSKFFEVFRISDKGEEFFPNVLGIGAANVRKTAYSIGESPQILASEAGVGGGKSSGSSGGYSSDDKKKAKSMPDTFFKLTNATIAYEGGTPATARSDVSVSLTYQFKGLGILEIPFHVLKTKRDGKSGIRTKEKNEATHIVRPVDLILFPLGITDSSGVGKIFKRQYNPNYCRLRIKYGTYFDVDGLTRDQKDELNREFQNLTTEAGRPLSDKELEALGYDERWLDLAIVDHDLKLKEKGGADEWELTINYRGYYQQLLTSPLFDCMSTSKDIQNYIDKEDEIVDEAKKNDCSSAQMRRLYKQFNVEIKEDSKGRQKSIMTRLLARDKLKLITVNNADLDEIIENRLVKEDCLISPRVMDSRITPLAAEVSKSESNVNKEPKKKEGTEVPPVEPADPLKKEQKEIQGNPTGQTDVAFFYIGDLLEIGTDCAYEIDESRNGKSGSSKVIKEIKDDVRFITTCFAFDDPLKKQTVYINISEIPISVDFFQSWFHDNVVKKDRAYYPVAAFVRDLCEVAVSNMLSEVCYGPSLEPKLHFRSSFVDAKTIEIPPSSYVFIGGDHTKGNGNAYASAYGSQPSKSATRIAPGGVLKTPEKKPGEKIEKTSYFIIHPMNHNIWSSDNNGKIDSMQNNSIPYLPFGLTNLRGPVNSIDFSKQDAPGLREARYYNSSQSGLTLLSNVYDVTIKLDLVLDYYPGGLIYVDPVDLTENKGGAPSKPHESKSLCFATGIGGYHMITNATYTFNNFEKAITGEASVKAKWVYSGAANEIKGQRKATTKPSEKKKDGSEACEKYIDKRESERVSQINKEQAKSVEESKEKTEKNK